MSSSCHESSLWHVLHRSGDQKALLLMLQSAESLFFWFYSGAFLSRPLPKMLDHCDENLLGKYVGKFSKLLEGCCQTLISQKTRLFSFLQPCPPPTSFCTPCISHEISAAHVVHQYSSHVTDRNVLLLGKPGHYLQTHAETNESSPYAFHGNIFSPSLPLQYSRRTVVLFALIVQHFCLLVLASFSEVQPGKYLALNP